MTTSPTGMALYQSATLPRLSRVSYHMSLLKLQQLKQSRRRTVDTDTGSSEIYISSSGCDRSCNHHKLYDASKSSTAHDFKSQFYLSYSDGSTTNGTLYTDDVTIAGYTVSFVHFTPVFSYRPTPLIGKETVIRRCYPRRGKLQQYPVPSRWNSRFGIPGNRKLRSYFFPDPCLPGFLA
jgi:hypothetical protein